LLQIKHSHTTPYHLQCNAQAEVQNKVIQKYLAAFVDKTTLDWPLYIAPMAFAYNNALHRSIKSTSFFLTYGIDARLPSLPDPDLNRYYGQSDVAAWYATLQHCRQIAAQNNIQASNYMQSQFNKKASPYNYVVGQMVWSDVQNFLGRNRKLSPNWEGPFPISKVYENGVVEIIYKNKKTVNINVARIKPYIEPVGLQTRNVVLPPIPINNFPPNNQNLLQQFQQRLPRQAVRPPPLDPLTLPPAPPHFQPPNLDPSLPIRDQRSLPDPPVFQSAPRILPPINFCLPLRPMPQLLACNFPPLPEPALPARAQTMAVPHLPPPSAMPARAAGQPKPPLFVPHFTLAPAPQAPQLLLVADRAVLIRNLAFLRACRLAGVRAVLALNTNNFSHFNSGDQNPFSPHSVHSLLSNPLRPPCSSVRPEPRPLLLQP
jgi:hypothetical protein